MNRSLPMTHLHDRTSHRVIARDARLQQREQQTRADVN
jgi:hypothetical protein